jgi:phosphate transport system permease protein
MSIDDPLGTFEPFERTAAYDTAPAFTSSPNFDAAPTIIDLDADEPIVIPDRPRHRARMTRSDLIELAISFLSGAAGAGLLRTVLGWHGDLGTGIWWYVISVGTYYLLQRDGASSEVGLDRVVTVLIWSAGTAVVAVLGWMLGFLAIRGYHRVSANFFTHDMSGVGPLNPGGGVLAAIVGSAEQVGLATAVVVPLAVLTAVYLHELRGRLSGVVRFAINALAGVPSIVAGLIIYTAWVINGHGPSGVAGAAALAILMLPFVTRTAEEVLRTVPDALREASYALGAPQWRVVTQVVLPTALAGLTTAVILGIALGIGETAPLLLTTSFANGTNWDPFHGPQASLAYYVYTYVLEPNKVQNQRGYSALVVLVVLVLILFLAARYIGSRSQRKLGRSR